MFSNEKSVVRFDDEFKEPPKARVRPARGTGDPLFRDHVEEPQLDYAQDYQLNFPNYNKNITKKLIS